MISVGDKLSFARIVSMESGLEDRNNNLISLFPFVENDCLNGVRPRRPEQFIYFVWREIPKIFVSMESGLEDRNNDVEFRVNGNKGEYSLNGVRPRRPEQ